MSVALLDVNVLLALLDGSHQFHLSARIWFRANRVKGWASCTLTQAGFVRIAAQPFSSASSLKKCLESIQSLCDMPEHRFWPLDYSLGEMLPEIRDRIYGHKQLTDAILLNLAIRREGRFVTLDRHVHKLLPEDSPYQNSIEIIPT